MKSVLVILAHPNFSQSVINRTFYEAAKTVEGVTLHDLYKEYPDGVINIPDEQQKILEADTLVFQHPLYWYSCPALLKEWIDIVLQYNFAYGPEGTALQDKNWLSVISTGTGKHSYDSEGDNRFTLRTFLTPFEQTAVLCNMQFLPPLVAYGAHSLAADHRALTTLTQQYQQVLTELVNDQLPVSQIQSLDTLNQRWEH